MPGNPSPTSSTRRCPHRALVLDHVLRDLRARFRPRATTGTETSQPIDAGLANVLDAARRQHEPEIGGPRLVGRARDRNPRLLINHLC